MIANEAAQHVPGATAADVRRRVPPPLKPPAPPGDGVGTAPDSTTHASAAALFLTALLLAGCEQSGNASGDPHTGPLPKLPTVQITLGGIPLAAEVADEPDEQARGLMFRPEPADDEAMLFVFPDEERRSFYMMNVAFDIDLAYVDATGRITQIERMKARNPRGVPSRHPARYVIELRPGWFRDHGVGVGDKLVVPPELSGRSTP